MSNTWSEWGDVNWPLVGTLALSWLIIMGCLIKGTKAYGKFTYFLTLMPYAVLTTLLVYVATLPGFDEGIQYYLTPQWHKLKDFSVWVAAASQIYFSLSIGFGGALVLSSYNDFKKNCHTDAISIAVCNSLTSIFSGFVVFGMLGFIHAQTGVPIEDITKDGPGLVFAIYPQGLAVMNASPQFFSFIFFSMLTLLGVTSVAAVIESVVSMILDQYPKLRKHRTYVLMFVCTLDFLIGLTHCFESGIFSFTLMDSHAGNCLILLGFLEVISVHWFYGTDKFLNNLTEDMEIYIPDFMKVFWKATCLVIAPMITLIAAISLWLNRHETKFMDYTFPYSVQVLGIVVEFLPVAIVVIFMVATIIRRYRSGESNVVLRWGPLLTPKETWGPRKDATNLERTQNV